MSSVASFDRSQPTDTFPTVTPGAMSCGFGAGAGGGGEGGGGAGSVGGGGSVVGGGAVVCAGTTASGALEDAMANPDAKPSSAKAASRPAPTTSTPRFTVPV